MESKSIKQLTAVGAERMLNSGMFQFSIAMKNRPENFTFFVDSTRSKVLVLVLNLTEQIDDFDEAYMFSYKEDGDVFKEFIKIYYRELRDRRNLKKGTSKKR